MSLKVHHLNCGSMCPYGKRFINGYGGALEKAHMVCHCLLIEAPSGLVLVDTGLGLEDARNPKKRLGFAFNHLLLNKTINESETAIRQIESLGFKGRDVTDIIVTHLDLDHTGGLSDFPHARVHLYQQEYDAFLNQGFKEKRRYREAHFAHQPNWQLHKAEGDTWNGFTSIKPLEHSQDNIALVPLIGHTRGHCGIAVKADNGWLLHAGDAYIHHGQLEQEPHQPVGLKLFQHLTDIDARSRRHNQERLRQLHLTNDKVTIFNSHDPEHLQRFV